MNDRRLRRALCLALLCALLAQLCAPARAAAESDTIYIRNANGLRELAARCAYDAWSEGKTVVLQRDVALGGIEFAPIASFGGVFDGNGHTISGLSITDGVSPAGLFGAVAATGVVRDLTVEGVVSPSGDGDAVGGVAGVNRGTILGCAFVGTVEGEKRVGGVAGENAATGVIRRCSVNGGVFGKNMTGGVAGVNHGTVSLCTNRAYVNTNTIDPTLSFDRLDLNLATGIAGLASPDIYNVTVDSGGIAGFSDGTLVGCRNQGSVGYQHIGYNVGGVAGRSSGHIATCTNEGAVYGRREVGGIAGMAEPYVKLDLKESSLEQVRNELDALSRAVDKTVSDAENASDSVSARLTEIGRGVDEATDRAQTLTGHLSDRYDETITEINRGSDVADAAIEQLYQVSDGLVEASDAFTAAADHLERAVSAFTIPDVSDKGLFDDLSRAAGELRASALILDAGVREIRGGLAQVDEAVGPEDETMSRSEWRKQSSDDLAGIWNGLGTAAQGMSEVSAAFRALSELASKASESGGATTPEELRQEIEDLYAALGSEGLRQGVTDLETGLDGTRSSMNHLAAITKLSPEKLTAGMEQIENGFSILADGRPGTDGGHGAAYHFAAAMGALQDASSDAERMYNALRDAAKSEQKALDEMDAAASGFRGALSKLTAALGDMKSLVGYLRSQDRLQFKTLGDETDAEADALYDAMRGVSDQLELLNRDVSASSDTVLEDVRQINRRFTALMNTLLDVVEDAEGVSASSVVEDTSDEDIEEAVNGKILLCSNSGEIAGDIDAGGIAGAMMVYNELDPENDAESVSSAFHRRYELKCVLQDCVNTGAVTGKRDNVGSVCGSATLGVISGCEAYGAAESEDGDCVGGIAGYGDAVVRKCWAKCALSGAQYVGGIVGSGRTERSHLRVEDCRALVQAADGARYAGSILGADTGVVSGNLFVSDVLPGINRVSERGRAEPVTYAQLMAEDGVPRAFQSFTLRFVADGQTVRTERFDYGASFDSSVFPAIPAREGQFARWDRTELKDLRFDTVVTAVYEPCVAALESGMTRSAARPVFLIEGAFDDAASLEASPAVYDFSEGRNNLFSRLRSYRRTLLEQWQLLLPEDGAPSHTIRYLPPEGVADHLLLYLREADGWKQLDTGRMGSYVTFEAPGGAAELTVVSTATPWWVWALVALFLAGAAALLAATLLRKKPKAPPQELTDEEKARLAAQRKKHRRIRRALVAAVLALGAAVGAVVVFAPGLTDSMGLYMMLRNYADRSDLDLHLTFSAHRADRKLDADVDFFTAACGDKRVSCVLWDEIPLYYCDGVMLLENGRAYRADGALPDYSRFLSHAAGLYRAMDVAVREENGVKTYHAEAHGEAAGQLLSALLPGTLETVSGAELVTMDLVLTDGEPTSLRFGWNGASGDAAALLRFPGEPGAHTLPQAVRAAVVSGEYADAPEIGPELRELYTAWMGLIASDPLGADVTLSADCGPLLLDENLTWQRTRRGGRELSCVSRRGTTIYCTDDAACTSGGVAAGAGAESFAGAAALLRLAYRAFLLGEATCADTALGRRYTLTLDDAEMAELAGAIAPETKTMGISFEEGTLRLDLADGAAVSAAVQCSGTLRVVRTDIPASVGALLAFREDDGFPEPSQKVLDALGLGE